ncbi:MAG: hypothetical protein SFU87_11410 [Chitinophagaceae bacterium]|nr:hypothetical protein [Chitinophagaceae bacterium]
MSKFVKRKIETINGKQHFFELVVLPENINLKNNDLKEVKGVWKQYEEDLEEKYKSSFRSLTAIMNRKANLQSLSKDKFRDITPTGEVIKEYEFKYQDLRAYGIKLPNEVLVILGGYKNKQTDDCRQFRALKAKYLESIKTT